VFVSFGFYFSNMDLIRTPFIQVVFFFALFCISSCSPSHAGPVIEIDQDVEYPTAIGTHDFWLVTTLPSF